MMAIKLLHSSTKCLYSCGSTLQANSTRSCRYHWEVDTLVKCMVKLTFSNQVPKSNLLLSCIFTEKNNKINNRLYYDKVSTLY